MHLYARGCIFKGVGVRDMRAKITYLLPVLLLAGFLSGVLQGGCGSFESVSTAGRAEGGGSSGSGVAISGTVEAPVTTSTSISIGASASKSVGKGSADSGEKIIVYKAVTDLPVSGGTVTAKTTGGTTLDTGEISSSGAITGITIDPAALDSTNQVLLECDVNGKKFASLVDLTGQSAGTTVSAGTVNTDTTLATQQVYYQGDPSCTPDNPSACAAKFLSGEVRPLALFKTFKNAFDVTSTAGSSDAAGAFEAMSKAFKAAMASGQKPSFSDINAALAGGDILNTWKAFDSSLASIDMSTAIGHVQNYIPAVAKTFQDLTTFTQYFNAGPTGWTAAAQYFGRQTGSELLNGFNKPEIFQGYLQQNATAFNAGNTAAFDGMKNVGPVMGQLAGKCAASDFTSAKYEALKALIDSKGSSFSSLTSTQVADMGEAFCNQMKAANSTTEIDALKNNPATFAGKIFDNPDAYTGSAGQTAFDNQFISFVQNPTAFSSGSGCSANADCPSGQVCTPGRYCIAECSSSCGFYAPCTSNNQCGTGYCSDGFCQFNSSFFTNPLAGVCKVTSESCSANTECCSGSCSSGRCVWQGNSGSGATGISLSAGDAQIVLNWTKLSGATGYKIYRSTTSPVTTSSTLVDTVGDVATYTDSGLTNSTTYYYRIVGILSGGDSGLSSEVSGTPSLSLVAPTGVAAQAGNAQMTLTWSKAAQATGYKIYRSTTSPVTTSSTLVETVGDVATYTNTGLTNGTTYYYAIASTASGTDSGLSSEVSGAPTAGIKLGQGNTSTRHSIIAKGDETVWAWGANDGGQIGDNSTTQRNSPVQVHGAGNVGFLTDVTAVAIGNYQTLALKSDGTLWAWGWNAYGEVGDNSTTQRNTPVQVHGPSDVGFLTGITAIAAGTSHSLALKSDGTVWAWGDNASGQLGDNNAPTDKLTPNQVHGPDDVGFLTGITAIAAGTSHSLALKSDGTVWAWGNNGQLNNVGQLGDNSTTQRNTPVQVHGPDNVGFLTGVSAITASSERSLALKSDGTVWGWGYNVYGELGDNSTTNRKTPVQVHGSGNVGFLTGITAIAAGSYHTLALKSDGTLWGWGRNAFGAVGDNSTTQRNTPVQVVGVGGSGNLTDVTAIAASDYNSMALKSDGTVWGWGRNNYGQLGQGTSEDGNHPTPLQISGF
ncbi:MAG: hypothetical protein A3F82_07035 [Deltaproteobacteria bacterium RIFCSPLOWO2_12_FULL_44_12]|nr:MAG: hypothetical protein A2712_09870 [Deltaproteobacteria bacterium RIFCSPHIGHO2_01_FULL_43_49]OGQ15419.1 MAG: hypothetical protein A3D22_10400 [Deltaproteobacteria bacterium RIFCSPHIGHO2_02_FULL_44_53]OGQ29612.1 MAG: hypothetical protein A3D98_10600 [Deltaproteobacteria bacterium RIFCSPHIGHO2_12_FULL_44_21]OGQ32225.1 MAG: hypothetical protein A2979_00245 [Deltaproteobacteria bacterium RIFCSPLOWO2_01_FULL_45_74]OGQ43867.1 MAG: hypothetical protein A3I70_04140 [Deltaproteobacteria bacterium 